MRSFYIVMVVFALLLMCSTVAGTNIRKSTGTNLQLIDSKRNLRSTKATDDATEERMVGITPTWLTKFRIWKLKREAAFQLNKSAKQLEKEMAEANKKLNKEAKEYHSWMAARLDPEDIYIKLGLAKMGYDDARNSPLFRRYEAYKTVFSLKAHDVKASGWMRNWLVRYRLGKLKSQAATEMKKADEQLAREQREYERWFREKFHPSYIFKKLGLDELAKPETSSNFRHFEMYQKLWDKRMNGVVDTVT